MGSLLVQPVHPILDAMLRGQLTNFPDVETLLRLEPEDVAGLLLENLNRQVHTGHETVDLLRRDTPQFQEYSRCRWQEAARVLADAWAWLERECLIAPAPHPRSLPTDYFVTRRGRSIRTRNDLARYRQQRLLPVEVLDPRLAELVVPLFITGRFQTAVLEAFKEVELRVRNASAITRTEGVSLMRAAFTPQTGPLTDRTADSGEQQGTSDLFAGALGALRNRAAHTREELEPGYATEAVMVANHLLRLLNSRKVPTE